jgi:hypothetical protein
MSNLERMGDLERILPVEIIRATTCSGNELVLPLDEAKRAVRIAGENRIATLGIEVFRILEDGLGTETYTGYGFKFDDNWPDYVRFNNEAALRFIDENSFGSGYGYILTSTSEKEFRALTTTDLR